MFRCTLIFESITWHSCKSLQTLKVYFVFWFESEVDTNISIKKEKKKNKNMSLMNRSTYLKDLYSLLYASMSILVQLDKRRTIYSVRFLVGKCYQNIFGCNFRFRESIHF